MRKSMWLLSAGLFALSMPAYAQETDTDAGGAQPTARRNRGSGGGRQSGCRAEAGSRDTSEIVVTATRRNEALSDVPLAVSAVTAETLENSGASDIRAADTGSARRCWFPRPRRKPARASRRYPRHRHGRRQPGPRKLGRGVHRRRLPLAYRRRPDRTRRDRPDRGASRTAGHAVRPQRVGRPHLDHHRQAEVQDRRSAAS